MDGYLTKPIDPKHVFTTIERVLRALETHPSNALTTLLPV
jgi:DNA-binding response OmpR family regulator